MVSNKAIMFGEPLHVTHRSIHEAFEDLITKDHGSHLAVIDGERRFTYADLNSEADRVAYKIEQLLHEDRQNDLQTTVAVLIDPSYERIVALLAVLKSLSAYLPLDISIPVDRCKFMIGEVNPSLLIYSEQYREYLHQLETDEVHLAMKSVTIESLFVESELSQISHHHFPWHQQTGSDSLACVLFTSGSTGLPKPVAVSHRNALNRLYWQIEQFPLSADNDDVGCHRTSILFVDSLTEIFGCLLQCIPLVIVQKWMVLEPSVFIGVLHRYRVTWLVLVPTLIRLLVTHIKSVGRHVLPYIRYIVSSGETLPGDLAIDCFELFGNTIKLLNFYGSTEVTGDVTFEMFCDLDDVKTKSKHGQLSVGKPVANCNVYVVNESGALCIPGEKGELFVSGHSVARAYRNSDDTKSISPNRFVTSPGHGELLRTGDFGFIENGRLYVAGRNDSQVKIRGQRVDLTEVDRLLNTTKGIHRSVTLLCSRHQGEHEEIVSFFVPSKQSCPTKAELRQICEDKLMPFMVPRLMELQSLPEQSHTGKVDRSRLHEIYRTTHEQVIQDSTGFLSIVANCLGIDASELRMSDSFFDIGGNSLNAISTVNKLRDIGYNISVLDFLTSKNMMQIYLSVQNAIESQRKNLILGDRYKIKMLSQIENKEDSISLLAKGFIEKNTLVRLAKTEMGDLVEFIKNLYRAVLPDDLSIVIQDSLDGAIVAATISADIHTQCDPGPLTPSITEILGAVDRSTKEPLLASGELWMDITLISVDMRLPASTVLQLLHMMEEEIIRIGRVRGYDGIITVNAHPATIKQSVAVVNFLPYQWDFVSGANSCSKSYTMMTKGNNVHARISDTESEKGDRMRKSRALRSRLMEIYFRL